MTRWLLDYLQDYRADALAGVQERWLKGELELSTEHELKGRMNALDEVASLEFGAVAAFYEQLDAINNQQAVEDQVDDAE